MSEQHWAVAERVTGAYMGVAWAGRIRDYYQHTINPRAFVVTVELAEPVTVLGSERTSVHFWVTWDGTGTSGTEVKPDTFIRAA